MGKFAVGDKGRKFIQDKSQRDLDLETKPTSQKSRSNQRPIKEESKMMKLEDPRS